ncbi:MAG: serine/threonine protein kinase [Candidatus Obscuribacterales bacterium]|nr:serine/threonine protein kinase [Candidatus Obscuribacterales bacterium]
MTAENSNLEISQPPLPAVAPERYDVLALLGQGGMGLVLKGRHKQLNKLVAIKVLNTALSLDSVSLKRFDIEAKAGSQLAHPNLIAVFDYGVTTEGKPYLVMEYVEGESLQERIAQSGSIEAEEFLRVFEQVVRALKYIHNQNIIHRDIKTSNIMLQKIDSEAETFAKLLDFGIAKVLADSGLTIQDLTATGSVFGSPLYMSPEQCRGKDTDGRSDIYSLGCVMHECFTGLPPVIGENALDTIFKHVNGPPSIIAPELKTGRLERRVAAMIEKCLEKDPAQRFQNAAELLEELKATREEGLALKYTGDHEHPPARQENKEKNSPPAFVPNQSQEPSADAKATNPWKTKPPEQDFLDESNRSKESSVSAPQVTEPATQKSSRLRQSKSTIAEENQKQTPLVKILVLAGTLALFGAAAFFAGPGLIKQYEQGQYETLRQKTETAYNEGKPHWAGLEEDYKKLLAGSDADVSAAATYCLRLGNINLENGNLDSAELYFKQALEKLSTKKADSPELYLSALLGTAEVARQNKKEDQAKANLEKALKESETYKISPELKGDLYLASARLAAQRASGDNKKKAGDRAIEFFDQALSEYTRAGNAVSASKVAETWLESAELCHRLSWTPETARRAQGALALASKITSSSDREELERRALPLKGLVQKSPSITPGNQNSTGSADDMPPVRSTMDSAALDAKYEADLAKYKLEQIKRAQTMNEQIRDFQINNTRQITDELKKQSRSVSGSPFKTSSFDKTAAPPSMKNMENFTRSFSAE